MAKTRISGQDVGDGLLTDADVASTNKDGATGTASMRTLGTGSLQAAAGNHSHTGVFASRVLSADLSVPADGSTVIAGGLSINTGITLSIGDNAMAALI